MHGQGRLVPLCVQLEARSDRGGIPSGWLPAGPASSFLAFVAPPISALRRAAGVGPSCLPACCYLQGRAGVGQDTASSAAAPSASALLVGHQQGGAPGAGTQSPAEGAGKGNGAPPRSWGGMGAVSATAWDGVAPGRRQRSSSQLSFVCEGASSLSSWTSGIPVTLNPVNPAVGGRVTLTPSLGVGYNCNWYRGSLGTRKLIMANGSFPYSTWIKGEAYTGRETVGHDCSLSISDLMPADSGIYTVTMSGSGRTLSGEARLYLEILPSPVLWPAECTVAEFTELILNCTTSEVFVSWFKDGELLPQWTQILTLYLVTKDDEGIYTCEARNTVSHAKSNPSIVTVIQDSPSQEYVPNLNITGPNEGIEGTITVLNCISKVPGVSYYWLKENRSPEVKGRIFLSNNNQTLTFNPILRSDIGDYTCYGDDRISKESATHQLVVLYGPDPPIISPSTRDYAEGSNLSLSCKAESNPPAQYLWFVDGNPKGSDSELLTINLSLNDAGNYICTAVNIKTKHNNSESLEIRVLQEVSDVTINGPSESIENTSVILTCTSRGSMVTYYWFKGKQSLKSEGHVSLSPPANQILIMNPVNRSDAGLYTCQGVNSISNDSSPSFPLEVFYGPDDPIISPPDQNYAEGSNLSLSCKATSNLPVEYTWLLNGTEEIFNETVGVGDASQLLIPHLSLKNSGTYSCHAFSNMTNITSYSDQPITVWAVISGFCINGVPEILSSPVLWPATSLVIENTKATLTCTTSDNTRVTISWFKEGQPLAANAGNNTLTFVNTAKDDTGIYTCEARNPFSTGVSNPSNLIVAYGPDSAVLDQNGTIVLEPGSRLPLVCTADSSPVTRFQWFFNRIQQNMTGNHFTVDLTAGEGEGNYTCQASNPFTRLTASAAVHVKLASHKPTGLSVGAIAGIVLGVVAVMALIGTLLYFLFRPRQQQRDQTSQPGISAPSLYEDIASSMVVSSPG
ncbi:carcinoembryonic antigen-related cell adhesion molecule 5-like [Hemicordylus capensis]|uniref:carcinoembryonic antigen-related cell adhesion molecule 5-like n=1 Tax=Hemicordylus capensis TaxID=884348 RepID=UPI002302DCB1|nr:carcinoembryonic antigen-related cell adhesion molecule 5-like [Hemicordylus capensis]